MSCRKSNFMYYLLFYLTQILVFYYIEQGLYQYWNCSILRTHSTEMRTKWSKIQNLFESLMYVAPWGRDRNQLRDGTFPSDRPRIYRVTILDSYNLLLTRIWNVPSSCLGRRQLQKRPTSCRNCRNQVNGRFLPSRWDTL